MTFNGQEGSAIDPDVAGDWTRRYREANPGTTFGHFFGRDILQQVLNEKGSLGIRFYYGLTADGARQLLAVAADAHMNDLLEGTNIVADETSDCPPYSSTNNVLNS